MPSKNGSATAKSRTWRPTVLVVDDEWSTLERIKLALLDQYDVELASRAEEALQAMGRKRFDVAIVDVRLLGTDGLDLARSFKKLYPNTQYILMTAFSDIEDTISAIRLGVADYLRKPFAMSEVLHALDRCLERFRLEKEVASLKADQTVRLGGLIAKDERMQEVVNLAETVATTDVTVLLSGETGTGKGVLARAIHQTSARSDKPFVEINCAAIPATLIESELFGHERGAFTGAVARKPGRVEVAAGGTMLLDEVGEMDLDMQAKLLRFLQEFSFERVGGNKTLTADVRIIAASNRDLGQAVEDGLFREDLFYRLHVIRLHLPALRERRRDILPLAEYFLQGFAQKYAKQIKGFSARARSQMFSHPWPGNVRELEHAVERAVILCRGDVLDSLELKAAPWGGVVRQAEEPELEEDISLAEYLSRCEYKYLSGLLNRCGGRIDKTAQAACINPKTLYLKMNRLGLEKESFKEGTKRRGDSSNG